MGNLREFIRGNADAMARRVEVEIPGTEIRPGVWVDDGTRLAPSARIEPPVVIGANCEVGEDVVIVGPTVIGDGCLVGAGAHLARALVLSHSRLLPGSLVVDGIIGQRAVGAAPQADGPG